MAQLRWPDGGCTVGAPGRRYFSIPLREEADSNDGLRFPLVGSGMPLPSVLRGPLAQENVRTLDPELQEAQTYLARYHVAFRAAKAKLSEKQRNLSRLEQCLAEAGAHRASVKALDIRLADEHCQRRRCRADLAELLGRPQLLCFMQSSADSGAGHTSEGLQIASPSEVVASWADERFQVDDVVLSVDVANDVAVELWPALGRDLCHSLLVVFAGDFQPELVGRCCQLAAQGSSLQQTLSIVMCEVDSDGSTWDLLGSHDRIGTEAKAVRHVAAEEADLHISRGLAEATPGRCVVAAVCLPCDRGAVRLALLGQVPVREGQAGTAHDHAIDTSAALASAALIGKSCLSAVCEACGANCDTVCIPRSTVIALASTDSECRADGLGSLRVAASVAMALQDAEAGKDAGPARRLAEKRLAQENARLRASVTAKARGRRGASPGCSPVQSSRELSPVPSSLMGTPVKSRSSSVCRGIHDSFCSEATDSDLMGTPRRRLAARQNLQGLTSSHRSCGIVAAAKENLTPENRKAATLLRSPRKR